MNRYESYKDSGVEWLGEVPSHWEVKKISHVFKRIGSGTTPNSSDTSYYDGQINWLQTGDLTDGKIFRTSKTITDKALKNYSTLKIYPQNSLVIAMYGATIGKVGLLQIETATNQACCVLVTTHKAIMGFVFYLFKGIKDDLIAMSYGGGQPNISQDKIKSLRLPFPPLSEQTAIAQYLDDKTAKIDQAIMLEEKQIELLKEHKQILIQNAVTKGLNPQVKFKDSGVEWLGEVPEHWGVSRLKNLCELFGRIGFRGYNASDLVDEISGAITVSPSNIIESNMDFSNCSYLSWEKYYESPEIMLKNDDIILVKTGSTFGKVGYISNLPKEATINPQLLIIRNINLITKYLGLS